MNGIFPSNSPTPISDETINFPQSPVNTTRSHRTNSLNTWIKAAPETSSGPKFRRNTNTDQIDRRIQQIPLFIHHTDEGQPSTLIPPQQTLSFPHRVDDHLIIHPFTKAIQERFPQYLASEHVISLLSTGGVLSNTAEHFARIYYQQCMDIYADLPQQGKSFFLQTILDAQRRPLLFRFTAKQGTSDCVVHLEEKVNIQEQGEKTRSLASAKITLPYSFSDDQVYSYAPQSPLGRSNPGVYLFTNSIKEEKKEKKLDSRYFLNELFLFHVTTPIFKRCAEFYNCSLQLFSERPFLEHFLNLSKEDLEEFFTIYDIYLLELFNAILDLDSSFDYLKKQTILLKDDPLDSPRSILLSHLIRKIINYAPLKSLSQVLKFNQDLTAQGMFSRFFGALNKPEVKKLFNKLFNMDEKHDLEDQEYCLILRMFLEKTNKLLFKESIEDVLQKKSFKKNETILHFLLTQNSSDSHSIIKLLFECCTPISSDVKNLFNSLTADQVRILNSVLANQKQSCAVS